MASFNALKSNFLGGELSPKVAGRVELDQYKGGADILQNVIARPQGGVYGRPGSQYVANALATDNPFYASRLIPFIYSTSECYVVEISGGQYQIINASNRTIVPSGNITAGAGSDLNYNSFQASQIQYVQSADTLFLFHPSYPIQMIVRTGTNTFTTYGWGNNPNGYGPAASVPYLPVNTSGTKFTPNGVTGAIQVDASLGTFLFNANHVGAVFMISNGSFQVVSVVSTTRVLANVVNPLSTTSATDGWYESAWSAYRGYPCTGCFYQGRLYAGGTTNNPDTIWGSQTFTYFSFDNSSNPKDTSGIPTANLPTYPVAFTVSSQQVNHIQWMASKDTLTIGTSGAEYIVTGSSAGAAITIGSINVREQTSHGSAPVQIAKAFENVLFVQRNGQKIRETTYDFYQQVYVADDLSLLADHMTSRFNGKPFMITQIQWAESDQVLWCVDASHGLFGMTRDRKQQVIAWHFHLLGGLSFLKPMFLTPSGVFSIAVVPSADALHDDLWLSVGRPQTLIYTGTTTVGSTTITVPTTAYIQVGAWVSGSGIPVGTTVSSITNGTTLVLSDAAVLSGTPSLTFLQTIRTTEVIGAEFPLSSIGDGNATGVNAAYFSDCAVNVSGPTYPGTTVTGLPACLEGQTVAVLGDGFVQTRKTVANSSITLDAWAGNLVIGLPFQPIVKPTRVEAGAPDGSAQGLVKRIDRVVARLYRCIAAKIGYSMTGNYEQLKLRDDSIPPNTPTPFYTGDYTHFFDGPPETDGQLYIWSDDPVPFGLSAIILRGETNER